MPYLATVLSVYPFSTRITSQALNKADEKKYKHRHEKEPWSLVNLNLIHNWIHSLQFIY